MNETEVMTALSELESYFFFKRNQADGEKAETLNDLWKIIRYSLEEFHALTGATPNS